MGPSNAINSVNQQNMAAFCMNAAWRLTYTTQSTPTVSKHNREVSSSDY